MATEAEIDALLVWPPIMVRGDVAPWERQFCASIIARSRRGGRLSDRQVQTLIGIRDRFQRRAEAQNAEDTIR